MSCVSDNINGNEVIGVVRYSLQCDVTTKPTDFKVLGGITNTEAGVALAAVDVTTGKWKSVITGQATYDPTVSGFLLRKETGNHQQELQDYIEDCAVAGTDPGGWVQFEFPREGGTKRLHSVPVMFLSMPITSTTNEAVTFDLNSESRGTPILETV